MSLTRKVAQRKAVRSQLNTVISQLEASITDETTTKAKFLGLRNNLSQINVQLNNLDEEILQLINPDDIEDDVTESMNITQPIYGILAEVEIKLEKMSLSNTNDSLSVMSNGESNNSRVVRCKLPKLELPVFRGSPLDWQGFWDQFSNSIHENGSISDVDKFNYLKRYLGGQALESVSGLMLNSDNYKEAVGILRERFGNPQVLISAHMDSLIKMQKVRTKDDLKGLRKLYNDIENCVRNLKTLKLDTTSYGSLFIPILKDKLPDELLIFISRKFGNNLWDLDTLLGYFHDELRAYENCSSLLKDKEERHEKVKPSKYTISNLHTQDDKSCLYCSKSGHGSAQCRQITNIRSRKDIVRRKGRCFVCLGHGHTARECTLNYTCRKCKGRHNISLCYSDLPNQSYKANENENHADKKDTTTTTHVQAHNGILLQTATVIVSDVDSPTEIGARVLFDTGSQRSYVTQEVQKRLCLKTIRRERVLIKTFGQNNNHVGHVQSLPVVQLKVKHKHSEKFVFIEALCVPSVCSALKNQEIETAQKSYRHISNLDLADNTANETDLSVQILIGVDYYHCFFTGRIKKGESGPVASETVVGWVLSGSLNLGNGNQDQHCYQTTVLKSSVIENHDSVREDLERFWQIDSVGLKEDESVMERFKEDIYHDGVRYVTKLPFKEDHEPLPDNFLVSERRLMSTVKKLKSNGILEKYNEIFADYEKNGIIERIPDDCIPKESGTVHYLPHRAVVRDDKETTKIRAVFDASCAVNGPSLNECLYAGPNLLAKIFDVLVRFRLNKIAIMADIKQAFLNVGINIEHQDFLRFLWLDLNSSETKLIMYKFLRVVFGVASSPFLLNATIKKHLENFKISHLDFVKRFGEDLYVDDTATGCDAVSEGKEFYNQAVSIMSEAGFSLRKWVSNDNELQKFFDEKEGCILEQSLADDISYVESQMLLKGKSTRVLGVEWEKSSDEFVFKFNDFLSKCRSIKLTKRNILSASASVYDPLGLISPITAWIKTIFQLLCKDKKGWDEVVPKDIQLVWNKFLHVLQEIGVIKVKRFVLSPSLTESIDKVELHGFCDSSKEVYCGVVYVRVVTSIGISSYLLASKTKVAPLKVESIPRLELLGCLLLSKLIEELIDAIKGRVSVDEIFCWTDSKVALCWIKGKEKSWKAWIENRVVRIRKVVGRDQWYHIAGNLNPADIPTRKIDGFGDLVYGRWFQGPLFLEDSTLISEYCRSNLSLHASSDATLTEHVNFTEQLNVDKTKTDTGLSKIVDYSRFSSLSKLINTVCYVLQFVKRLKKKTVNERCINSEEYRTAMELVIKDEQKQLRNQENFEKLKSSLNLFIDENGILRLKGRFGNANHLTYQEKFPALLRDGKSYVTRLIVLDAHERVLHHGIETTLARIRNEYWIIKGRKTIKTIIRKCFICTRFQGRTMLPPPSPDLPDFRVSNLNAFHATGLDYCGPLFIKNCKADQKVYVLLLTCASSRAVHLELTPNLRDDSFIRAFKRFVSRRGTPNLVVHDNAKTFLSAESKRYLATTGVTQRCILPASPWWGGFYERLVRTVKTSIKKTLGKSFVTYEELLTVLCEIEAVMNSRPLHYSSEDDLEEVLTPNHLIFGRNITRQVSAVDQPEINIDEFGKRLNHVKTLLSQFWKRFTSTYLNELRQNNLYRKSKTATEPKLKLNDIVLIRDDIPLPRAEWRIGKVEKLVIGSDGLLRGAKLRVLSKSGRSTIVHRPLQKLILFEITAPEEIADADNAQLDVTHEEEREGRLRRKAANEGQYLRRLRSRFS